MDEENKINFKTNQPVSNRNINPPIETEDPLPSLSDWHDYEPNLEFDDSEVHVSNSNLNYDSINDSFITGDFQIQNTNDEDDINETLEADNYEEQFNMGEHSSINISKKYDGIVDHFGTDSEGQLIIAIFACRLPPKHEYSEFVKYLIEKLENYVTNDYVLVYFHQGINEDSKPSPQFLWNAYKQLDRDFKKNLKKLYVVHPTYFIRILWACVRKFTSEKFSKKLVYVSSVRELKSYLNINIKLPEIITEFDEKTNGSRYAILDKNKNLNEKSLETAQFGVSLKFIIEHSTCLYYIPPIVRTCVDHLSSSDEFLETEGIFRRSGNFSKINELKKRVNSGEDVKFEKEENVDVFIVTGLLKSFFRDLSEPLLTFELYEEIIKFSDWNVDEKSRNVKQMLREKIPKENYAVFQYIVEFLVKVSESKDLNKMTTSNLAIVFAPNLIWSQHIQMSLNDVVPINAFLDYVLQNRDDIYMVDINKQNDVE